jgi:hypothetical protein
MTDENKERNGNLGEEPEPETTKESSTEPKAPAWEADLDVYPLRPPSEDPRWAVRTVVGWVVFALISLAFILVLLVLGAFYD